MHVCHTPVLCLMANTGNVPVKVGTVNTGVEGQDYLRSPLLLYRRNRKGIDCKTLGEFSMIHTSCIKMI